VGHASAGFATAQGVRQLAGRTPAAGGRLPLGKAVGQAWALFLAGLLAVIGGLALLVNPGSGLRLVKWTLGLFLVGWGVLRLVHAFSGPRRDRTWLVLSGLCILGAGIVVLVWPGVTVTALLYILVVGGLCLASVDLVGAVVDRRRNPSWWLQLLRGLGTLALVVALLVWPGETLGVVRLIAAVLLLLWGASTIGEAYQSPIHDDPRGYRGQMDKEIPHRLI
jgi:uncharacterized membrane protein HdeD (DUF308 family)